MKNTFKLTILLCAILLVISGCVDKEIQFMGVIVEIYDNSILVEVYESDVEHIGRDFVEIKGFHTIDFKIGDVVHFVFEGKIDNNFPSRITVAENR